MSESQCHICLNWCWEFQLDKEGNCDTCNKKACQNCGLKLAFLDYKVYDFESKLWLCGKCEEVEL